MTLQECLEHVRSLVAELHEPGEDADPLGVDSLTVILLVESLEDRLGIQVSAVDLTPENFATRTSLAELVFRKLA